MRNIGKAFAPSFIPFIPSFKCSSSLRSSGFNGVGACLIRGVSCIAEIEVSRCTKLDFIYGDKQLNLPWIENAVKAILNQTDISGVRGELLFNFELPLCASLSIPTSALVSSLVSIYSALNLEIPPLTIGDIAHEMELKHKIGVGVSGLLLNGGLIIVKRTGIPSNAEYFKINYPNDLRIIVAGRPLEIIDLPKYDFKEIMSSHLMSRVQYSLDGVISFNDLINKIKQFNFSHERIYSIGIRRILNELRKYSPLLCGVDFDGKTLFAVTYRDKIDIITNILLDFFPCEGIFISEIDPIGVRVYY